MIFNYASRTETIAALTAIAGPNGWDINAMIKKANDAGLEQMRQAEKFRVAHKNDMATAAQKREAGLAAAVKILTDAQLSNKVDVTKLRLTAKQLVAAARFLDRKHLLTVIDSTVDTLLAFLGTDRSVFAKMVAAADKATADADAIEARAEDNLAKAEEESNKATDVAEQAFIAAANAANANLAKAVDLEKAAKAIFKGVKFFTV